MSGETVLAVTSNALFGQHLVGVLGDRGHVVALSHEGQRALVVLDEVVPDAVLFDLAVDQGWDTCRQLINRHPLMSVVVMAPPGRGATARARFEDHRVRVVNASDAPALVARQVQRVLLQTGTTALTAGDVVADRQARRVWVGDTEPRLRAKEFDLLVALMANAGRAVSRHQLMEDVWHEGWTGPTKTLDVHIAALRRRLGEDKPEFSRITTIRGVGYRFELVRPGTEGSLDPAVAYPPAS
jgi:DNA-binding response OmpR family regulator